MGKTPGRRSVAACVAVAAMLFIAGCSGNSPEPATPSEQTVSTPEPTASPTPKEASTGVHPERGYIGQISSDGKKFDCAGDYVPVDLVLDGTVTFDGINISALPDKGTEVTETVAAGKVVQDGVVVINFGGANGDIFKGGFVNGKVPFLINGYRGGTLSLKTDDFGFLKTIQLCGAVM